MNGKLSLLLWSVPTLVLLNDALFTISLVKDDGMHPAIKRGDLVVVDRTKTRKLETGTVVLMRNPEAPRGASDLRLVRRLECRSDSRFAKFRYVKDYQETDARDSNDFGPVPEAIVLGKVLAVVFPPWRAGLVRSKLPS